MRCGRMLSSLRSSLANPRRELALAGAHYFAARGEPSPVAGRNPENEPLALLAAHRCFLFSGASPRRIEQSPNGPQPGQLSTSFRRARRTRWSARILPSMPSRLASASTTTSPGVAPSPASSFSSSEIYSTRIFFPADLMAWSIDPGLWCRVKRRRGGSDTLWSIGVAGLLLVTQWHVRPRR